MWFNPLFSIRTGSSIVVPGVNSFNPEIAADKFGSPERYLVPADTGEIQNTARHNPIRIIHGTLAECNNF